MRTKTYIQGFKNSQKIRVMFEGIGVYTTVAGVSSVFATYTHSQAANDALLRLLHQICNTFCRLIFSKLLCPPLIKTEVELFKSYL